MKKIVVILLFGILVIPMININASNIPLNENININKIETKYKWYRLKEIDSREENVFEHSCEYLKLKETEFSEWNSEYPDEKLGRVIESNENIDNIEYYYITINKLYTEELSIKEIRLIDDKGNELEYTITNCYNCLNFQEAYKAYDNDYNTVVNINFNSYITMKLNEPRKGNIRIKIIYDKNNVIYGWVYTLRDESYNDLLKKEETISSLVLLNSPVYNGYLNSKSNSWTYLVNKMYRYKDNYLVCYEKEYLNGYFDNVNDYIKDEERSITNYIFNKVQEKTNTIYKYITLDNMNENISKEVEKNIECSPKIIKEKCENNNKKAIYLYLILLLCVFIGIIIRKIVKISR